MRLYKKGGGVRHCMTAVVLALAAILGLGSRLAVAATLDLSKLTQDTSNLVLEYKSADELIEGVETRVWKVAETKSDLPLTSTFAPYASTLEGLTKLPSESTENASYSDSLAATLASAVDADSVAPGATAISTADGRSTFSNLENGIYLVLSSSVTTTAKDGTKTIHSFAPALVALPNVDEDGEVVFDVVAYPKPSSLTTPPDAKPEPKEHKVTKKWVDTADASKRPTSVEVVVLCDGETFATSTLDATNDWTFEWKDDGATHEWKVYEKVVPDGYKQSVKDNGDGSFTVTNTRTVEPSKQAQRTTSYPRSGNTPKTGDVVLSLMPYVCAGCVLVAAGWMWRSGMRSGAQKGGE